MSFVRLDTGPFNKLTREINLCLLSKLKNNFSWQQEVSTFIHSNWFNQQHTCILLTISLNLNI